MSMLRASPNADRRTALMAADLLRNAHLVPQRPRRRGDARLELRGVWARIERTETSILVQAHSLDLFEEPRSDLLCTERFRTIAGRCRRACLIHAEVGLAGQDDGHSRMLAIGAHERLSGTGLGVNDRIVVLSPSPLSPCRIAVVRNGLGRPEDRIVPDGWLLRLPSAMVLKLRRDLDRISVGLDPAVASWSAGELEGVDAVERLRAIAWLEGRD